MTNENEMNKSNDALLDAFLHVELTEDIVVKAEDIEMGGGLDFSEIFFEPQVGHSYKIRFVQNPETPNLVHRRVYKGIPDPDRRGKAFHYVSSGDASTDPALDAFFTLNKDKKDGNALAEQKIKKYLGNTNQSCSIIQVITSTDDKVKPGIFRLFTFSNYGPNATIANLVNEKVNPSAAKIEDGEVKENIWNIFEASQLIIEVTEATYDGNKGRDFTKSSWSKKKIGVTVTLENNTNHTFSNADLVDGKLTPEATVAFKALIDVLKNPNLSIHNYFSYKVEDHPLNTKETNDYLKKTNEKIERIVPVILNAASIAEIENACKADSNSNSAKSQNTGANILAESLPAELQGSMVDTTAPNTAASTPKTDSSSSEAENILGGM